MEFPKGSSLREGPKGRRRSAKRRSGAACSSGGWPLSPAVPGRSGRRSNLKLFVIPAKAGIQLDPRLRGGDKRLTVIPAKAGIQLDPRLRGGDKRLTVIPA